MERAQKDSGKGAVEECGFRLLRLALVTPAPCRSAAGSGCLGSYLSWFVISCRPKERGRVAPTFMASFVYHWEQFCDLIGTGIAFLRLPFLKHWMIRVGVCYTSGTIVFGILSVYCLLMQQGFKNFKITKSCRGRMCNRSGENVLFYCTLCGFSLALGF